MVMESLPRTNKYLKITVSEMFLAKTILNCIAASQINPFNDFLKKSGERFRRYIMKFKLNDLPS